LWKLVRSWSELKPGVQSSIVDHLVESGNAAFGWAKLCLQSRWPCVAGEGGESAFSRSRQYITLAESLLQLSEVGEEPALAIYSSKGFLNVFYELWIADDRYSEAPLEFYRMVDVSSPDGCSIIALADILFSKPQSREAFLNLCTDIVVCGQFSLALTDRVTRGREVDEIQLLGWILSMSRIASITAHSYESSTVFCQCLAAIGH
jgi:hypothetical protein